MPAPQRYPTPGEQLVLLAVQAREEGLSFDEFWERAVPTQEPIRHKTSGRVLTDAEGRPRLRPCRVLPRVGEEAPGAVLWPRDTRDRRDAYEATCAMKEGWRRAYEKEPPTPAERAMSALRPFLAALADSEEEEDDDSEGSPFGVEVPLPA